MSNKQNLKASKRKLNKNHIITLKSATIAIILGLVFHYIFHIPFELTLILGVLIMVFMLLILLYLNAMFKHLPKAPFTGLMAFLLTSFILLPLLFSILKLNNIPDLVKGFFSVAVPIGVNSVFDGLFKIIETNYKSEEKNLVVRYGGTVKFLFNSVYIATILGIITIQTLICNKINLFSIFSIKSTEQETWATLYFFTIIYFALICLFGSLILKAIQKEIKNIDVADTEQIKRQIIEKKQMISNIQTNIENIDKNISIKLKNIEDELSNELKSLDSLD